MNNHLVNSRNTVIFQFLGKDENEFFNDLHVLDKILKEKLKLENVMYEKLKPVLSPANKGDVAFVFDWSKVKKSDYGEYILDLLMPYLCEKNFCYLHGDYCIYSDSLFQKSIKIDQLKESLYEECNDFVDASLYYIVYISGLGIKYAKIINNYLKQNEISYVGFSDLKYNSYFKTFLSMTLIQAFVKYKNVIIEPDVDVQYVEKKNYSNYISLKKYDYTFLNINSDYYCIFLEYRIPALICNRTNDLYYSLKYLNSDATRENVKNLKIIISKDKILYLLKKKKYILDKWGLSNIDDIRKFLIDIIKKALLMDSIFDIKFVKEYETYQFNLYIEYLKERYKIGLKLILEKQELFFLTLTSINK